ncbi:hypothetical protein BSL78_13241 [Apostichopus japonicus]|uniref:Leucine-rich repeat-containing protein 51 n=1 Tax=Stichopus japonicus TaxID=307972 RepID=A0A2G8KPJ5_STIJA|nr:hypothetical protein BSL78_13241 [Apostichopus japonicus]
MTSFYNQLPRFPEDDDFKDGKKKKQKRVAVTFNTEFPYPAPPIDFSFRNLSSFEGNVPDLDEEPRRHPTKIICRTNQGKYESTALKLCNNLFEKWKGFDSFIAKLLHHPEALYWLDLSFNFMYTIDSEILKFPQLKILYLHGNAIQTLSEVDKLSHLSQLQSLTLHGNALDEEKGYRLYVIKKVPNLRALDFSRVTKSEITSAQNFTVSLMLNGTRRGKQKRKTRSADL